MSGKFTSATATNTGADAVLTVPAGQKWRVKSTTIDILTSAATGIRTTNLLANVGGLDVCFVTTNIDLNPSNNILLTFAPGLATDSVESLDGTARIGCPELVLGPGDSIQSSSGGLQSGDVITINANIEAFLV